MVKLDIQGYTGLHKVGLVGSGLAFLSWAEMNSRAGLGGARLGSSGLVGLRWIGVYFWTTELN